jgi:hypothetical protein
MIMVGHARCQVIEGSEIEYPSAVARCEQRMEPGLPQAVVSCLVKEPTVAARDRGATG